MQRENRRASDLSDILVLMIMRYTNPRSDSLYSRACKRVVNVKDQFSQKAVNFQLSYSKSKRWTFLEHGVV